LLAQAANAVMVVDEFISNLVSGGFLQKRFREIYLKEIYGRRKSHKFNIKRVCKLLKKKNKPI